MSLIHEEIITFMGKEGVARIQPLQGGILLDMLSDGKHLVQVFLQEGITAYDTYVQAYSAVLRGDLLTLVYRITPQHEDIVHDEVDIDLSEMMTEWRSAEYKEKERQRKLPFIRIRLKPETFDWHGESEPAEFSIESADEAHLSRLSEARVGYQIITDSDGETVFEFYEDEDPEDKRFEVIGGDKDGR